MTDAAGPAETVTGRRPGAAIGRTLVHEDEVLRHPLATRVLHWSAAIFFLLALLSGFAIYTPWLFQWLTPVFGGGPRTRLLHPWFSLAFVAVFALQVRNWIGAMRWTPADSRWLGHLKQYATNTRPRESEEVGFFNAGQKLYFWVIVVSAVAFLVSGIIMWFLGTFGRAAVAVSYVLHDLAALVMLGAFIGHLYLATAQQPGTWRAMTRGTVTRRWAWTHHPAWYRQATRRDPDARSHGQAP